MSKVYAIRLQRSRNYKIRVCGKDSISSSSCQIFRKEIRKSWFNHKHPCHIFFSGLNLPVCSLKPWNPSTKLILQLDSFKKKKKCNPRKQFKQFENRI